MREEVLQNEITLNLMGMVNVATDKNKDTSSRGIQMQYNAFTIGSKSKSDFVV